VCARLYHYETATTTVTMNATTNAVYSWLLLLQVLVRVQGHLREEVVGRAVLELGQGIHVEMYTLAIITGA